MTLNEALAQARRNCGLSTVDMPTTDLTAFVQQAEVEVALALLEVDPQLATLRKVVTIPGHTTSAEQTFACNNTNFGNVLLPTGRQFYKISEMWYLSSTTDTARRRLSMTKYSIEMAGSGIPTKQDPYTASTLRILFDGANLRLYPPQQGDTILEVGFTRLPVAQTTGTGAILADFTSGSVSHLADALVCMKAASDAMGAWGWDNTWQEGRVSEMKERLVLPLGCLQLAEAPVNALSRWKVDYCHPGA